MSATPTRCFHQGRGCTSTIDGDDGRQWVVIYATGPAGASGRPKYGKALPVCSFHGSYHRLGGGSSVRVIRNPKAGAR